MTDREPSHYQRLGVTPAASTEEIRVAYRALVARLHPDRVHDAPAADRAFAERRTREVNEAWRVLRDPEQRRLYDASRRAEARHRGADASGAPATTVARPGTGDADSDAGDLDPTGDEDLVDVLGPMTAVQAGLVRHLPWLLVAGMLIGIFVLSAYADRDDGAGERPASRAAAVGDCLDIPTGTATTIVTCDGPHDFEVVARVVRAEACPAGTEARRLAVDQRFDCLRAP